jgi:hypothetical protein
VKPSIVIDQRVFRAVGDANYSFDKAVVVTEPTPKALRVMMRVMIRFFLTDVYGVEHTLAERTANPGPYPSYISPVYSYVGPGRDPGYMLYVDWYISSKHQKTLHGILREELAALAHARVTVTDGQEIVDKPVSPWIGDLLDPSYKGWRPNDLLPPSEISNN